MTWQDTLSMLPGIRAGARRGPVSDAAAAEAAAIERDFPGWHVWISSLGRWWAVRQGRDARHGVDDPRPMTVDADDPAGLREQLAAVGRHA